MPATVPLHVSAPGAESLELETAPFDEDATWTLFLDWTSDSAVAPIPAVPHRVRATTAFTASEWIEVVPSTPSGARVELNLLPTRKVTADGVAPDGSPVAGAVWARHTRTGTCPKEREGRREIGPVPGGSGRLEVGTETLIASVWLEAGDSDLDLGRLVLRPGCAVEVDGVWRTRPIVVALEFDGRDVGLLETGHSRLLPPGRLRAVPVRGFGGRAR